MSADVKSFDLKTNSLNQFFKEMYVDQPENLYLDIGACAGVISPLLGISRKALWSKGTYWAGKNRSR